MSKNYGSRNGQKLFLAFILISVGVGSLHGTSAVINLWANVVRNFFCFFPILGAKAIENYLTSPYFIVSIIMLIASGFGIHFGRLGGQILWYIVSIIVALLNLTSIGINLL